MKAVIYSLCKRLTNAVNFAEIADSCLAYPLNSAEMPQEVPAFLWADTGYSFQRGGLPGFAAPLPMSGDGKSMGLIAGMLDQM